VVKIVNSRFFKPFIIILVLVVVGLNVSPMSTEASMSKVEIAIEQATMKLELLFWNR